nr:MAG TPA: hypothetical protein [Caudoviricetes sp.]DAO87732.1 MAG TPA: hypothetical protein [Caudoviricetes sp.]
MDSDRLSYLLYIILFREMQSLITGKSRVSGFYTKIGYLQA